MDDELARRRFEGRLRGQKVGRAVRHLTAVNAAEVLGERVASMLSWIPEEDADAWPLTIPRLELLTGRAIHAR